MPAIEFTGIPFMFVGTKKLVCHQGKDLALAQKQRYAEEKAKKMTVDHSFGSHRSLWQNTKKVGCPAAISISKIATFPKFKVVDNREWSKKTTSKMLRQALERDPVVWETCYAVTYLSAHAGHATGEMASIREPGDVRVEHRVAELTKQGVRKVSEVKRHLAQFVRAELFRGTSPHPLSRHRYFPSDKDLRNIMARAKDQTRYSKIDRENLETNNTTFPDGACPELKKLDLDTFQCPFCNRAGEYPGLMAHLQGHHQRSIVKYGGYNVYKCHHGCVASSHYHCGFCPRIIVRKELFLNHFKNCCTHLPTTVTTAPATTSLATTALPMMALPTTAPATTAPATTSLASTALATASTAPAAAATAPKVLTTAPVTTETAASVTALAVAAVATTPPATGRHISTPPKLVTSKLKKTCCLCNLQLQKKNLKVHMQRHHSLRTSEITANHHLQSVCVDKKRGIFAVSRTFKGPVHYIHVQKCTWGVNHQVSCHLETCKGAYDDAWRSGLLGFDCDHIRSLVYSPAVTNSTVLDEGILTEMVLNKWLSKDTESVCLRRKLAADADSAPLSVEVNLGQEQGRVYFSVLEPDISSYSRLGRVMVHYDDTKNAWHCPCSKPQKSCPHKSIAKWHLRQSRPDFFAKIETCRDS